MSTAGSQGQLRLCIEPTNNDKSQSSKVDTTESEEKQVVSHAFLT